MSGPKTWTEGPVWHNELCVGDIVAIGDMRLYGPVVAITDSPSEDFPERKVARFANDSTVAMTGGIVGGYAAGHWFPPWPDLAEAVAAMVEHAGSAE